MRNRESIKYKECNPIKTYLHSTWVVEWKSGKKQLLILDKGFTTEKVVEMIKIKSKEKEFRISMIGVGIFNLDPKKPIEHGYQDDGRWVDQDMNVGIDNNWDLEEVLMDEAVKG